MGGASRYLCAVRLVFRTRHSAIKPLHTSTYSVVVFLSVLSCACWNLHLKTLLMLVFFCVCLRSQSQAFSALALPWRYGTHDSNDLHRRCSHEGSCPHRSTLVLRKDSVIYFHGRSPHHIQITSAGARSPWSSSEAYMFLRSWRSSIKKMFYLPFSSGPACRLAIAARPPGQA